MKTPTAVINKVFFSIQGEGPFAGQGHIFVRFGTCNLACSYCDTKFRVRKTTRRFTPARLLKAIERITKTPRPTIALTGGEPLLHAGFLKTFLPLARKKKYTIFLETNATLPAALQEIIHDIDIVSADYKLQKYNPRLFVHQAHQHFFSLLKNFKGIIIIKIVGNPRTDKKEILSAIDFCKAYAPHLIFQPLAGTLTPLTGLRWLPKNVRIIPQLHKILGVA